MKKFSFLDLSRLNVNIPLLVFLVMFLNVKFVVKVLAILFIVLYYRDWKWGFSLKRSRLPLFYLFILLIECFKYLFVIRNYGLNYALIFFMGALQWLLCILSIHHLKLAIDRDSPDKVNNTIRAFYLLNSLVSLFFLLILVFHPAWLSYWGHGKDMSFNSPSAGDTIQGISFDASTVNATINCLGLIYFLYKKDNLFTGICFLVIVLCTSNTTFLMMMSVLALMVLTVRSRMLRIRTLLTCFLLVVTYLIVSSSNREYIRNYFVQLYILNKDPSLATRPDSSLRRDSSGRLVKVATPQLADSAYSIDKNKFKRALGNLLSIEEVPAQKERASRVDSIEKGKISDSAIYPVISETAYLSKPGKLISFVQTYAYLKMNMRHLLFGAGVGNFSSKLAFRASGENISGTYPKKYQYISPEFRYNHLRTYQFYARRDASKHSVLNYPFSVYNQVLGEYGLIGALLFGIFYLGYFVFRYRRLSYGRYMIILLLGFFLMEYWFELFSLMVIFELFLLLNIKEGRSAAIIPGTAAIPEKAVIPETAVIPG
jgi:hypothetical protein